MTVHEHVQQVLSAGLDGQVDDDQRFLAERHLEQCGACAAAAEAFARAAEAVRANAYDMVVLDELLGSIKAGLVALEDVLKLVRDKPPTLHLVLTGRGAPQALIDAADLVTEMTPIKHPFERGIKAQRGIEF